MSNTLLAANRNVARSARKNKKIWHGKRRAARRNIDHRFEGTSVENALDMVDDYEEQTQPRTEATFAKVESDRKYDVFDRREGDRLSLYFRWAEKVTDHLDTAEERLRYIAENTPVEPYLISHAIVHLKMNRHFSDGEYSIFSVAWFEHMRIVREQREAEREHAHKMIKIALKRIIENDKHDYFNKLVSLKFPVYQFNRETKKDEPVWPPMSRPFYGLHDIEAYAEEVMRIAFSWHRRHIKDSLIEAIERCSYMQVF